MTVTHGPRSGILPRPARDDRGHHMLNALAGRAGLGGSSGSTAGNVGRVGGAVRHPIDLPEGYHAATRGAELIEVGSRAVEGCAPERRVVGLRQVDGMPHSSQRGDEDRGGPCN
jgi:hypothetical protein